MPLADDELAAMYREHGPMLRRLVTRATGDPAGAEDVVQEVILRMWRHAPEVHNVRAYLAQSARNLLVDQHRARARRPQEQPVTDEGRPSRGGPPDMPWIDRVLDQILVEQALARLSPEHRAVVRALHYERASVAQAATALGIPEGTVKSRAHYALRHLRVALDELGASR